MRREHQQQFVVINELPAPQRDKLKRHGNPLRRWTDTGERLWQRRRRSGRAPAEVAVSEASRCAMRAELRDPTNRMTSNATTGERAVALPSEAGMTACLGEYVNRVLAAALGRE